MRQYTHEWLREKRRLLISKTNISAGSVCVCMCVCVCVCEYRPTSETKLSMSTIYWTQRAIFLFYRFNLPGNLHPFARTTGGWTSTVRDISGACTHHPLHSRCRVYISYNICLVYLHSLIFDRSTIPHKVTPPPPPPPPTPPVVQCCWWEVRIQELSN